MWVKNEVHSALELRVAGSARRAELIGWAAAGALGTPRGPTTTTQPQLYPDTQGGRTCVLVACVSRGTSRYPKGVKELRNQVKRDFSPHSPAPFLALRLPPSPRPCAQASWCHKHGATVPSGVPHERRNRKIKRRAGGRKLQCEE